MKTSRGARASPGAASYRASARAPSRAANVRSASTELLNEVPAQPVRRAGTQGHRRPHQSKYEEFNVLATWCRSIRPGGHTFEFKPSGIKSAGSPPSARISVSVCKPNPSSSSASGQTDGRHRSTQHAPRVDRPAPDVRIEEFAQSHSRLTIRSARTSTAHPMAALESMPTC